MRLSEAIKYFYDVNRPIMAAGSMAAYRIGFEAFSRFLGADLAVTDIVRDHIVEFRAWLLIQERQAPGRKYPVSEETPEAARRRKAGKLAAATVHQRIRSIKRLFNFLTEEGILERSPVQGVRNVPLPPPAPRGVQIEAARAIIELAQRPVLLSLYQARDKAISSLMRSEAGEFVVMSGELARLQLGDVQWDRLKLVKKNFVERTEQVFYYQMTDDQAQAFYEWLAVRPLIDGPHVFMTLDERAGEGYGAPMRQRAIYSAYWAWKNRSEEDRETLGLQIEHDELYRARRLAFILLMADSGARRGGLLGLTWERVDLARKEATVIEKNTGGGKSRIIFFCEATAAALGDWQRLSQPAPGASVFGLTEKGLVRMMARIADLAGVDEIHNPHAWRHAFARAAILQGGDLATVSQMMGHSTVQITGDYYARFNTRELKRAHAKISPVNGLMDYGSALWE